MMDLFRMEHSMLALVSVVCLSLVLLTSVVSLFSFGQRITLYRAFGHVMLGVWALTRLEYKVFYNFATTPEHLLLHLSLGILCIDTLMRYYRTWRQHKRNLAQENSQGEPSWLQQ